MHCCRLTLQQQDSVLKRISDAVALQFAEASDWRVQPWKAFVQWTTQSALIPSSSTLLQKEIRFRTDLLCQKGNIPSSRQGHHLKSVPMLLHNIQCLCANGPYTAGNNAVNGLHFFVQPIEHAAMLQFLMMTAWVDMWSQRSDL
jgi:hypothetical protein